VLLFIQLGKQLGDGRAIGNLGWRVVDLYFNGDPLPFYSIALFDRNVSSFTRVQENHRRNLHIDRGSCIAIPGDSPRGEVPRVGIHDIDHTLRQAFGAETTRKIGDSRHDQIFWLLARLDAQSLNDIRLESGPERSRLIVQDVAHHFAGKKVEDKQPLAIVDGTRGNGHRVRTMRRGSVQEFLSQPLRGIGILRCIRRLHRGSTYQERGQQCDNHDTATTKLRENLDCIFI